MALANYVLSAGESIVGQVKMSNVHTADYTTDYKCTQLIIMFRRKGERAGLSLVNMTSESLHGTVDDPKSGPDKSTFIQFSGISPWLDFHFS